MTVCAIMRNGCITVSMLILVTMLLASCRTMSEDDQADRQAVAEQRHAVHRVNPNRVAPPPGIEAAQLIASDDPARLERAALTLDQVVAQITLAPPLEGYDDWLSHAAASPQPIAEPSVAAQRHYIAGRVAMLEGDNFQAIRELEAAARLAPQQAHIQRQLALIYLRVGNTVKATEYLQQTLRSDPTQADVLYMLARASYQPHQPQQAIAVLARALKLSQDQSDRADRALNPLLHYHLGMALRGQGYTAAAIEQISRSVRRDIEVNSAVPFAGELLLLQRRQSDLWVTLGDLYHQQNEPTMAMHSYRRAAAIDDDGQLDLLSRMVYTHLRLNQPEAAAELSVEYLREHDQIDQSLQLLMYVVQQGVAAQSMFDAIRLVYEQRDRTPAIVMAMSQLLGEEQALALLEEHLAHRPGDRDILRHWMDRLLTRQDQQPPDQRQLLRAINHTATVMALAPEQGREPAVWLLRKVDDPILVITAFENAAEADHQAHRLVIYGLAHASLAQFDQARQAYEQAMRMQPNLLLPRLELVRLLLVQRNFSQAGALLEPYEADMEPQVIDLRVRLYRETNRHAQALALLDRMIASPQVRMQHYLDKAEVLLEQPEPDAQAAERTLLRGLDRFPRAESLYMRLLRLYQPTEGVSPIADASEKTARVVNRLMQNVPQSRLARQLTARQMAERMQINQAINVLQGLLEEDSQDLETIEMLLQIYRQTHRHRDAEQLLDQLISKHPQNIHIVRLAHRHYLLLRDEQRAGQYHEKWLLMLPPSEERTIQLAQLYLQSDQPDKAAAVLEQQQAQPDAEHPIAVAMMLAQAYMRLDRSADAERVLLHTAQEHPQHREDVLYYRAILVYQQGDIPRYLQLLRQLLEVNPDHPSANNNLAYHYAQQGENLDEALTLIRRVVEQREHRDESAYLDTMGWVLYKRGEFEQAVDWLRRAYSAARLRQRREGVDMSSTISVVVDHLGDALYQLGEVEDAVRYWNIGLSAAEQISEDEAALDSDLADIDQRLRGKIEAVNAGQEPLVAPLPRR